MKSNTHVLISSPKSKYDNRVGITTKNQLLNRITVKLKDEIYVPDSNARVRISKHNLQPISIEKYNNHKTPTIETQTEDKIYNIINNTLGILCGSTIPLTLECAKIKAKELKIVNPEFDYVIAKQVFRCDTPDIKVNIVEI